MIAPLKSKKKIDVLFEKGTVIKEKNLFIRYYDFRDEEIHFGVSVSKRFFKSAVTRNRLKRRMRESVRKNTKINEIKKGTSFFLIYNTSKEHSFQDVDKKVCTLVDNLISKIN